MIKNIPLFNCILACFVVTYTNLFFVYLKKKLYLWISWYILVLHCHSDLILVSRDPTGGPRLHFETPHIENAAWLWQKQTKNIQLRHKHLFSALMSLMSPLQTRLRRQHSKKYPVELGGSLLCVHVLLGALTIQQLSYYKWENVRDLWVYLKRGKKEGNVVYCCATVVDYPWSVALYTWKSYSIDTSTLGCSYKVIHCNAFNIMMAVGFLFLHPRFHQEEKKRLQILFSKYFVSESILQVRGSQCGGWHPLRVVRHQVEGFFSSQSLWHNSIGIRRTKIYNKTLKHECPMK